MSPALVAAVLVGAPGALADGGPAATRSLSTDLAIACELADRFPPVGTEETATVSQAERTAVGERLDGMAWRKVAAPEACGAGEMPGARAGDLATVVSHVARSRNGRLAALRGSWRLGMQTGGGQECLFERRGGGWIIRDCRATWVA